MRFVPLCSGSSGNATYIEAGNARLLIDAGLSCRRITELMTQVGADPRALDAIFVTHEHIDHIRGISVLSRKYHIPVYANADTWAAMETALAGVYPSERCVFESDKSIIHYESLGLGRIIYQLPTTLCEMFLNEVFKKNPIETLDEDTLETINRFFENNLNVSETSRKLYVHRNTLVYRLEKIKKITGLDLREFDHAIVFKVAMMVKQYLDSLNSGSKY